MMKHNTFFCVCMALTCSLTALAQETKPLTITPTKDIKHEISVGWGMASVFEFADVFSGIFGDVFTTLASGDEGTGYKTTGAFHLEYCYHFTPKVLVGLNLAYEHTSDKVERTKTQQIIGTRSANSFCIMPTFKWNWFNRKYVSLYSRISLGVSLHDKNEDFDQTIDAGYKNSKASYTSFAFQVSPIGVEAGSYQYRGFLELGCGYNGIGQIGFRARF